MVMLISLLPCLVSCIMIACCAIVGSTMIEHIASYMYCTHHHSWVSGISDRCVAVLLFGFVGLRTQRGSRQTVPLCLAPLAFSVTAW